MSIKVIVLIWEENKGHLTGIEKSILIRLADFGSDNGKQIFPGYTRLSLDTGFSRSTVIRTIQSLVEKNVLRVKNRKSNVKNLTNLYSINVKLLKDFVSKEGSVRETLGSVRETLGVVSERHPIRQIEPLHKKQQQKAPVDNLNINACGAAGVALKNFDITEDKKKELIAKHGEQKVLDYVKLTNSKPRDNPEGYFLAAIEKDYKLPQKIESSHSVPWASEEIARINEMEASRKRLPDSKVQSMRKELKASLGRTN